MGPLHNNAAGSMVHKIEHATEFMCEPIMTSRTNNGDNDCMSYFNHDIKNMKSQLCLRMKSQRGYALCVLFHRFINQFE